MRMKPKWFAAIVYVLSAAILSAVLFVLVPSPSEYFLAAYAFTLLAATVLFGMIFYYLSDGKRSFREFPANAPYGYIAIQYLIFECVVAAGMWLLGALAGLPIKYFYAAETVLAVIFGVRFAVAFGAKSYVAGGEEKRAADAGKWRALTAELQALSKLAYPNAPEAQALKRLAEAARFSDPIGLNETAALDQQIEEAASAIRGELNRAGGKPAGPECGKAIARAERLLEERGALLRSKKR